MGRIFKRKVGRRLPSTYLGILSSMRREAHRASCLRAVLITNANFDLNFHISKLCKLNELADNLRLSSHFSVESFLRHVYDIMLVTVGHGEGL